MTAIILHTVGELRAHLDSRRSSGNRVAVVPTMGALHEGHLSLVREATRRAQEVVVTIFVNPTQFAPGEDFSEYPRQLEEDSRLASSAGATTIFAPPVAEMYSEGEQTRVAVPGIASGMCGTSRPDHFGGVATVVTKIFNVCGPGVYLFGKKDYQQWRLIERMARDLLFPVEVVGQPTVRESDGLALSSRNTYLSSAERVLAREIPRSLQVALDLYKGGMRDLLSIAGSVHSRLSAAGFQVDYVATRDTVTLAELTELATDEPVLLAVAARLGRTRLIDNIVLSSKTDALLGVETGRNE